MKKARKRPEFKPRLEHGGKIANGKRKLARPIDVRYPLFVSLHSSKAKGANSLSAPSRKKKVDQTVREVARRFSVSIESYENLGNGIELTLRARRRESFQSFLRAIGGMVARLVTGAKKGKPSGKFWDAPVYSRMILPS